MQHVESRGHPGRDLYAEVTSRIVDALERGVAPWVRPWKSIGAVGGMRNAVSGYLYSGINVMLLGLAMDAHGFSDPRWLTYQQARRLGGQVRRGERGSLVIFWRPFTIRGEDDDRLEVTAARTVPFLRHYTVFNVAQVDGVEFPTLTADSVPELERDSQCDEFVQETGAVIQHGGNVARYRFPPHDDIEIPKQGSFLNSGAYYATLFHELVHWTGEESRSPRPFGRRFGDPDYAREELVAEMGSAFLCQRFSVDGTLQHPEYLNSWLQVLKEDRRALFEAASKARQACVFLLKESEGPAS